MAGNLERRVAWGRGVALALLLSLLPAGGASAANVLKPFKDDLFAYPAMLRAEGTAYRVVDYREYRDINERDQIPERQVKAAYVDLGVRSRQKDLVLKTDAGDVPHVAAGTSAKARFIVVYIHGQGGNRLQGASDLTFGGNFNRLKNLAIANGGLYLAPDVANFEAGGIARVAALIDHYAKASPGAPVIVACGSAGGAVCWGLAGDAGTAASLSGLVLLGSFWDDSFRKSPAFRARVPVFFGHGSKDRVFDVDRQEAFFRSLGAASPGYPARFVRFETGTHGTPIRMIDWRETLNWMLTPR